MPESTEVDGQQAILSLDAMIGATGADASTPPNTDASDTTPSTSTPNPSDHTNGDPAPAPAGATGLDDEVFGQQQPAPQGAAPGATTAKPAATPGQAAPGAGHTLSRAGKLATIKDPTLQEHLKQMGNGPFNYFYDLALKMQNGDLVEKSALDGLVQERMAEHQTSLEEAKSARYFDHEEGYKLTPEYVEVNNQLNSLNQEQQFWQEQSVAIAQGQPFQWLTVEDGKLKVTGPFDPKQYPQASPAITQKIALAATHMANLQAKIADLPKTHKAQYEAFNGKMTNLDKALFGNAKAPAFAQNTQKMLSNFPKYMHARPEIQLLAKALAAGQLMADNIRQLNSQVAGNRAFGKAMTNGAPAPVNSGAGRQGGPDLQDHLKMLDSMVK